MRRRDLIKAIQMLVVAYCGMGLGAISTSTLPALWAARTSSCVLLPAAYVVTAVLVIDVWRWRPEDGSRVIFIVRVVASLVIILTAISLISPPAGPCPMCPPKSPVRWRLTAVNEAAKLNDGARVFNVPSGVGCLSMI